MDVVAGSDAFSWEPWCKSLSEEVLGTDQKNGGHADSCPGDWREERGK